MYIVDNTLEEIVKRAKERFPERFEHIKPDRIFYVRKLSTGKYNKNIAKIRPIREPFTLLTCCLYFLEVMEENWTPLTDESKEIVVEHELMHISMSFDGSTIDHDTKDFRMIIEEHGLDYLKRK